MAQVFYYSDSTIQIAIDKVLRHDDDDTNIHGKYLLTWASPDEELSEPLDGTESLLISHSSDLEFDSYDDAMERYHQMLDAIANGTVISKI